MKAPKCTRTASVKLELHVESDIAYEDNEKCHKRTYRGRLNEMLGAFAAPCLEQRNVSLNQRATIKLLTRAFRLWLSSYMNIPSFDYYQC